MDIFNEDSVSDKLIVFLSGGYWLVRCLSRIILTLFLKKRTPMSFFFHWIVSMLDYKISVIFF